jgi:FkbM family methyltransferase
MRELRFLAHVAARRRQSKAQILQDLWVCFELGDLRGGYFVEFGATDGRTNSNTYLLETEYGWKGILAEPNPVWHARLRQNRACIIDTRCVASSTGKSVKFLATDHVDSELSGIAEFANGDHFAEVRAKGCLIEVETVTLLDLLRANDAPAVIDYLSIDTEGSEYDILSAFDFSVRSRLISVEHNSKTEKNVADLLARHGYVRVFPEYSQWDGWYVSREQIEKSSA